MKIFLRILGVIAIVVALICAGVTDHPEGKTEGTIDWAGIIMIISVVVALVTLSIASKIEKK